MGNLNWHDALFAGGFIAVLTAIGGFWAQIKAFIDSIIGLFIVTVQISNSTAYNAKAFNTALEIYFFKHFKEFFFGEKTYKGAEAYIKNINGRQLIVYRRLGNATNLFWKGWIPVWFGRVTDNNREKIFVRYIRGTLDIEQLIIKAVDEYNSIKSNTEQRYTINYITGKDFSIKQPDSSDDDYLDNEGHGARSDIHKSFKLLKWKPEDLGIRKISSENYIITSKEIEEALEEAKHWKDNESWYYEHFVPWKIGWLFVSPPGQGKTSLARTIAEILDLPVYVFDLSTLGNKEFREGFNLASQNVPCMVLIEDLDSVFNKKDPVAKEKGFKSSLTFDCLLNCIDGIQQTNGLFIVITANDVSKIDEAIASEEFDGSCSRPGRIDKVIHFHNPDNAAMKKICSRILEHKPEIWNELIEQGTTHKDTTARFINRCRNEALKEKKIK